MLGFGHLWLCWCQCTRGPGVSVPGHPRHPIVNSAVWACPGGCPWVLGACVSTCCLILCHHGIVLINTALDHLSKTRVVCLHRKLTRLPSLPLVTLLNYFRYHSLLELGEKRKGMLEKSCKKFMLFREANELQQWINEKEAALTSEEVGADLEQVEVLQKKFDDFQKVREVLQLSGRSFKDLDLLTFDCGFLE